MKDPRYLEFRADLEKTAVGLTSVDGYDRLIPLIKRVASWDEYMEIGAQINTAQWFKEKNLLKEIEPKLPHREGYSDILLSFSAQDIYCEVTSPASLQKSIEAKKENEAEKVRILLKKQPGMSKLDIEHELKVNRIARNLLEKTKNQLPLDYPGILALETGKSIVSHLEVKEIAKKLLPTRPQVMLIVLGILERGSQIGEAPFWFVNPNSPYQNIGQELLKYLGQDNKVIS